MHVLIWVFGFECTWICSRSVVLYQKLHSCEWCDKARRCLWAQATASNSTHRTRCIIVTNVHAKTYSAEAKKKCFSVRNSVIVKADCRSHDLHDPEGLLDRPRQLPHAGIQIVEDKVYNVNILLIVIHYDIRRADSRNQCHLPLPRESSFPRTSI